MDHSYCDYNVAVSQTPRRVLITAFAPFAGRAENSSSLAVRALTVSPGIRLLPDVPVVWADETIVTAAAEHDAELVVAVGEAAMRAELRFERVARNLARGADTHGVKCDGLLDDKGPGRLESNLPPEARQRAVNALRKAGLRLPPEHGPSWLPWLGPPDWETSAGAFLCNATYYRLLSHHPHRTIVFIHVRIGADPQRLAQGIGLAVDEWTKD